MSFRSMLQHRCRILRLEETIEDGSPIVNWAPILYPLNHIQATQPMLFRCFLDLTFIRRGKDPQWTPEAGRPADRTGVFFALGDCPLQAGDRIEMVMGPNGIFETTGAFDEAWTPRKRHHLEVGVSEVAAMLTRPQYSQQAFDG